MSANEHVFTPVLLYIAFLKNESLFMHKSIQAKIDKNSCTEINTSVVKDNRCYWAVIFTSDTLLYHIMLGRVNNLCMCVLRESV